MADYMDITSECTFSPNTNDVLDDETSVNVSYIDDFDQTIYTASIPINTYPRAQFNHPYNVSSLMDNCSNMLNGCSNFNSPVSISEGIKNCDNMFKGCSNFNYPFTMPSSVENCSYMFGACSNFNQSIILGGNVNDCSWMFAACSNFDQPITIPSGVNNCNRMFYGCNKFNQSVTVPKSVNDCSYMFSTYAYDESDFGNLKDQSITFLGDSDESPARNFSRSLYRCLNKNLNVYMGNICGNIDDMFYEDMRPGPFSLETHFHTTYPNYNDSGLLFNIYNIVSTTRPLTLEELNDECSYNQYYNIYIHHPNILSNLESISFDAWPGMYPNGYKLDTGNGAIPIIAFYENGHYEYINGLNVTWSPVNGTILSGTTYALEASYTYKGITKNTSTTISVEPVDMFDANINISNTYLNCGRMFRNCVNFNSYVTFVDPNNAQGQFNCTEMFFNCFNFDKPITIPDNANCSYMFCYCSNFNQSIVIGNNVINCHSMFKNCSKLNKPITFGNSINNFYEAFFGCYEFDQQVNLSKITTPLKCQEMFAFCNKLNSQIIIGDNVVNCYRMFVGCSNFNQDVRFGNNVTDISSAFINCTNFNSRVYLKNNVQRLDSAFRNCYNYNQQLVIPDNTNWCMNMLENCTMFGDRIFINSRNKSASMLSNFNVCGMLKGYNKSKRIEIWCNNLSLINGSGIWDKNSITGENITWTQTSDGYKNGNLYLIGDWEY